MEEIMIKEMVTEEFLAELSSKKPTPGGGGAAALGGAAGVSLGQMVINLTLGKKKYADVEEEMKELLEQLETLKAEFLHLADEDARVFAPLAAAYGLPGTTDEEKKRKAEVLEGHLLTASLVPLHVMEDAQKALVIMDILAEKGSRMAVSDVGVGVQFIRTALTGAVMNVWINTKSMKDREKAEELNRQADEMMRSGTAAADAVYQKVENALR
jgi:formiminotetrahydrofolate cyclodeaminase